MLLEACATRRPISANDLEVCVGSVSDDRGVSTLRAQVYE